MNTLAYFTQGIMALTWQILVMYLTGGLLIFLAVKKNYEPMLLLPILLAPLLCKAVKPLQNALDDSIQIAKSKRHLKKLKNMI